MKKRFLLSALMSALTVLVLNGAIYPLFYGDFLKNNSGLTAELFDQVQKPVAQTDILFTILSMIFLGCFISTVILSMKATSFSDGAKFGLLFSSLMVGAINFGLVATTHYYSKLSGVVDTLVGSATIAVAGGVAGVIMGRHKMGVKSSPASGPS